MNTILDSHHIKITRMDMRLCVCKKPPCTKHSQLLALRKTRKTTPIPPPQSNCFRKKNQLPQFSTLSDFVPGPRKSIEQLHASIVVKNNRKYQQIACLINTVPDTYPHAQFFAISRTRETEMPRTTAHRSRFRKHRADIATFRL